MISYPPSYGGIYVISDIHLGGRRDSQENFQIFNRGERLGNLIRHITEQRREEDIALILNGDIIDSLAEKNVPGYVALDRGTAERMMVHMFDDPSFKPVWDGLTYFIGKEKRHLVFIVGNHDIELSLPVVEHYIRRRLAENNGNAESRIHFATHGSGFTCSVAGAQVFCTHGNEVDEWNCVDYNLLSQLANAINAGRTVEQSKWKPNAGTRLVIDVMNKIKRDHPFVDVLKPETAAVASILLALNKNVFKDINLEDAFPILRDKIRGSLITKNLLGAEATDLAKVPTEEIANEAAEQLLGPSFLDAVNEKRTGGRYTSEDDLLRNAEKAIEGAASTEDVEASERSPETLGLWDMITGWVGLVPKPEALRRALKDWLKDDRSFDVDNIDDTLFEDMKDRAGNNIDFVVTGHTHKPRALCFSGNRYYYNCGTWIRTLRLTKEVLDDQEAFEKSVWPALNSRLMDALDNAMIPGPNGTTVPLLFDRTNVVRISARGKSAVGELFRVTDDIQGKTVKLDPEPGTSQFKVEKA
ncbi:MAG: metallophosphoesterase [Nitrospirota bacterium]